MFCLDNGFLVMANDQNLTPASSLRIPLLTMTNLPEDAASKLEEIVNHLSQDVVLGKGDWKTLEVCKT
jgi:hypothetical protein